MKKEINYMISRNSAAFHNEIIEIDKELECLYINIDYPQEVAFMTFLLIYDEKGNIRFQKLLGYGEQNIAIGNTGYNTTVGGVVGSVKAGEWTLTIGLFTEYVSKKLGERTAYFHALVTDAICDITEPIGANVWMKNGELTISPNEYDWNQEYNATPKWYKGDFHTHTTLSDGKYTVKEAMERATEMNLDFYVPTEHNLMHTGWCDCEQCIIPGIEITTNYGHFNIFGITEMPTEMMTIFESNDSVKIENTIHHIIDEVRQKGSIVSINHPFLTEWKWECNHTILDNIDCIELINDPTYTYAKSANDMTVECFDLLWNDGHKIYAVGGSDSHNRLEERYEGAIEPSIVGDPTTHVYCEKLTPNTLLEHVKKGHVCVTRFCNIIPEISIGGRKLLPGEEVTSDLLCEDENLCTYRLEVLGQTEKPQIYLVLNGEYVEIMVKDRGDGTFIGEVTFELTRDEWIFARMEVRNKAGEFLGFVNPIYCGKKESKYVTFGEIKELLKKE